MTNAQEFFVKSANSVISDINSFLKDLNLTAKLIKTYDWRSDTVGIYIYGSSRSGVLRIGINFAAVNDFIEELEEDEFVTNIEDEAFANISVTLWHEAGHGLVEHIKRLRRFDTQQKTGIFKGELLSDLRTLYEDEEKTVEDFGEFMAGYGYNSSLFNFIEKWKNKISLGYISKNKENSMETIKIKESKLREMISEAVSRNIFGGPIGESDNYRGCENIKIRWHGEWSDPELLYNGYLANYYDIEDYFYNVAKEEGIDIDNEEEFNQFIQSHEEDICQMIMDNGEKETNPFEDQE